MSIRAEAFVEPLRVRGFRLWTGVPCSYLTPLINYTIANPDTAFVPAHNEGDAIAIGAGAQLAGVGAVVMMQNSGLGNAINPLTSLTAPFQLPVLLIVTLRGDPNGAGDEPQHALMGRITTSMLDLVDVAWEWFPEQEHEIAEVLERACGHIAMGRTYALVMRKGAVRANDAVLSNATMHLPTVHPSHESLTRADALRAVQTALHAHDTVIATTGYTSRELLALDDRANQFYMVGSMGCAASIGLGLALARPDRRVVVIDGDGALLMRLGVLATVGATAPENFVHVLLDNAMHESTGGQATVSGSVDFVQTALSCGYAESVRAMNAAAIHTHLGTDAATPSRGARFVHVPTVPGTRADLPRPSMTLVQVADRIRQHLSVSRTP